MKPLYNKANRAEHTSLKMRYYRARMEFKIFTRTLKRNNRRKSLEVEVAHLVNNIDLYINDKHPYAELAKYAIMDLEKLEAMSK